MHSISNLRYASLNIPEIPDIDFNGVFLIQDEKMEIGIEYASDSEGSRKLIDLIQKRALFTVHLKEMGGVYSLYTAFNCFSLTPLIPHIRDNESFFAPVFSKGFLSLYVNSWISGFVPSLEADCFSICRITIPNSEPLFRGCRNQCTFKTTHDEDVSFIQSNNEIITTIPYSKTIKESGAIIIQKEKGLSIKRVIELSIMLHTCFRFISGFDFPEPGIILSTENKFSEFDYHGTFEIYSKTPAPTPLDYSNLKNGIGNFVSKGFMKGWDSIWEEKKSGLMLSISSNDSNNPYSLLVQAVKAFDDLYPKNNIDAPGFDAWMDTVIDCCFKQCPIHIERNRAIGLLGKIKEPSLMSRLKKAAEMYSEKLPSEYNENSRKRLIKIAYNSRNKDAHGGDNTNDSIDDVVRALKFIRELNGNIILDLISEGSTVEAQQIE